MLANFVALDEAVEVQVGTAAARKWTSHTVDAERVYWHVDDGSTAGKTLM